MVRKFIITGGPCTGKTSVINELAKDFKVVPEVGREVLKDLKPEQRKTFKIQYEIFKKFLEADKKLDGYDGIVFCDMGILCPLAFFRFFGLEFPEKDLEKCKKESTNYETVFILDPVPFEDDDVRKHINDFKKIQELIKEVYEEYGYEVVRVPLMSVEGRVDFIKKIAFEK